MPAFATLRRGGSGVALAPLRATTAACAGQHTTRSGFITDVGVPGQDTPTVNAPFVAEASRWTGYTAVLIDPPAFVPSGEVPDAPKSDDVAALTAHYDRALHDAYGARYRKGDAPGPGVMPVRAAVTGYSLAGVVANILTTPLVGPVSNGGAASKEAAFRDLPDGGSQVRYRYPANYDARWREQLERDRLDPLRRCAARSAMPVSR